MVPLSARTIRLVGQIFPAERDRQDATRMLVDECADTLPLCSAATPVDLERIRFAALRVSEGDLRKLREGIALAAIDWRDLLMNAGFGLGVGDHDRWFDDVIGS
ncbi:MAG TPA: hypothetical protein PLV39_10080 [Fimbriimonadaceae bacterium]|nr:hypothetical protein [Fimbriimonadaceae bacterium]